MVSFLFGCGARRRDLRKVTGHMIPQGNRYYQVDYDRGAIIRDLPDGRMIHRYCDEQVWRDAFGKVLPDQPQENNS